MQSSIKTLVTKSDPYKPAAPKTVLLFLAGLTWFCVGAALLFVALSWWAAADTRNILYPVAGLVLGVVAQRLIFSRIVDKNLERLLPIDEKKCVFSFIPWKSYLIILVMIALGSTLRHSALPREYLAIAYSAIGLALLLSSLRYAGAFRHELRS